MLSVAYVECRLCCVVLMQSVANKPIMLSVVMLNVSMLSVVALKPRTALYLPLGAMTLCPNGIPPK